MYEEQEKDLLDSINADIANILIRNNVILAGGALTSIFSGGQINDYDLFFSDSDDCKQTIHELSFSKPRSHYSSTKFAENFVINGQCFQCIKIPELFWNDPKEILSTFDFTICQAAYDFSCGKFILHENFIQNVGTRTLIYNINNKLPVNALRRAEKYKKRGYELSEEEFLKIIIKISSLKLSSFEDFIPHVNGMYEARKQNTSLRETFEHIKKNDDFFNGYVTIQKELQITRDCDLQKILDNMELF